MAGSPDWGGTALQAGHSILTSVKTATLARNAAKTYTLPITRPGYLIRTNITNTTNTTTQMPVRFDWQFVDQATGTVLDNLSWSIFAGANGTPHSISGSGPTKGNQLVVTVTNQAASAATLTFDLIVMEVTSTFDRHDWHTDDTVNFTIASFTSPETEATSGLLCGVVNLSLAAGVGGQATRVLPLYTGAAQLYFSTASSTTDLEWWLYPEADVDFPSQPAYANSSTASNGVSNSIAYMPRVQSILVLQNNNAATKVVQATISAAQI